MAQMRRDEMRWVGLVAVILLSACFAGPNVPAFPNPPVNVVKPAPDLGLGRGRYAAPLRIQVAEPVADTQTVKGVQFVPFDVSDLRASLKNGFTSAYAEVFSEVSLVDRRPESGLALVIESLVLDPVQTNSLLIQGVTVYVMAIRVTYAAALYHDGHKAGSTQGSVTSNESSWLRTERARLVADALARFVEKVDEKLLSEERLASLVATDPAAVAGAAPSTAPRGSPRVWLVAVGISAYARRDIALAYAAKDARAVHDFYAGKDGGTIPADRRVLLTDGKATRAAVLSALTTVAGRTAPEDLLIVYLALHGFPDAGGDLYFLVHDTDPNQLVGTGLPQRDLEYALSKAGAKRIALIADACHSGAAGLGGSAARRALVLAQTNSLIRRIAAARPGMALLTASSASEASIEGEKWKHGVFTYYLLEGLRGKADADGDRFVTVRELFDYVYREVSEATGGRQHPELKGTFDNALPLAGGR
jgi:uncharacterized caspase-like protein